MSQNDTTDDTKKSGASDVLAQVAETLKNSTDTIRARLTATLVERKLASRVDTLDKGLLKLQEGRNDLRKLKADQVSIDADGTKRETFSKDAWEKKNKAEEALGKLEKAVEAALSGESFDKLQELLSKG